MQCRQEVYHPFQPPPPGFSSKAFLTEEVARLHSLMAGMSQGGLGGWEESKFAIIDVGFNDEDQGLPELPFAGNEENNEQI